MTRRKAPSRIVDGHKGWKSPDGTLHLPPGSKLFQTGEGGYKVKLPKR